MFLFVFTFAVEPVGRNWMRHLWPSSVHPCWCRLLQPILCILPSLFLPGFELHRSSVAPSQLRQLWLSLWLAPGMGSQISTQHLNISVTEGWKISLPLWQSPCLQVVWERASHWSEITGYGRGEPHRYSRFKPGGTGVWFLDRHTLRRCPGLT